MAVLADDVDLGRDRDLVSRFQNGDPEAFDDLYRRYFERLRRFCLRHTRDAHEAEEVAQEAFVRALYSMHRLEGERRFYPWLTVIAKRIVIDRHRKLARVEVTDEPDLGTVDPDVDHLFAEVDAAHVRAALDKVGVRHREVLLLREGEGMSYADIASTLQVPVTTVEALLHRARKALRREFAAVGGDRRGLFGVPFLAWATTRVAGLRTRVGDRWAEIGAVMAPLAVGAATAAVVLVPGDDPQRLEVESSGTTPVTSMVEDVGPVSTEPPPAPPVTEGDPAPPTPPPLPSTTAPPAVDTDVVDVFIGPEGTDRARDEAEDMPMTGTVGPAVAGADIPTAEDHLHEVIHEAVSALTQPSDHAHHETPLIDDLLGGSP